MSNQFTSIAPQQSAKPHNTNPFSPTQMPQKILTGIDKATKLAIRELNKEASLYDIKWLFENRILWLRVLVRMDNDLQHESFRLRSALLEHAPPSGKHAGTYYSELKRKFDQENAVLVERSRQIKRKVEEVKLLFGIDQVTLPGDMAMIFVRLGEMIADDDLESALDFIHHYAEQWKNHENQKRN